MSIEALVAHYGLAALFVGAGLEGEAAVLAGGLLAHQGLVSLPGAIVVVIAGSFLADQAWFQIGRRFRDHPWVAKVKAQSAYAKAMRALERHPIGFIFAFRFIYGLRTVSPIAIGTTHVSPRLFVAVNLVSAIVWGVIFTTIGYQFGHGFERLVGRYTPDTPTLVAIAVGVVAIGAAIYLIRRRRAA